MLRSVSPLFSLPVSGRRQPVRMVASAARPVLAAALGGAMIGAPLARTEHWSGATIKKTGQGEIGIEVPDKTAALHTGPWVARKMTVETTGARGVGVLLDKTGVSLTLEEAAITSSGDLGLDSSY